VPTTCLMCSKWCEHSFALVLCQYITFLTQMTCSEQLFDLGAIVRVQLSVNSTTPVFTTTRYAKMFLGPRKEDITITVKYKEGKVIHSFTMP
jgi:hypothetical protein